MQELTEEQRKELEKKLKSMSPEELREFQKQQCVFCQITSGKVESKKVFEDEKCIVVLDINPASKGHVLVLPKEHYAISPQIPEEEIGHFFVVAKKMSQAMLKGLKASGTNVFVANGVVAGQKAQHFMIHVIPRFEGDKVLSIPQKQVGEAELTTLKKTLRSRVNELFGLKKEVVEEPPEETKEEPKEESKEEKKESKNEEGVSLDDIAALFS